MSRLRAALACRASMVRIRLRAALRRRWFALLPLAIAGAVIGPLIEMFGIGPITIPIEHLAETRVILQYYTERTLLIAAAVVIPLVILAAAGDRRGRQLHGLTPLRPFALFGAPAIAALLLLGLAFAASLPPIASVVALDLGRAADHAASLARTYSIFLPALVAALLALALTGRKMVAIAIAIASIWALWRAVADPRPQGCMWAVPTPPPAHTFALLLAAAAVIALAGNLVLVRQGPAPPAAVGRAPVRASSRARSRHTSRRRREGLPLTSRSARAWPFAALVSAAVVCVLWTRLQASVSMFRADAGAVHVAILLAWLLAQLVLALAWGVASHRRRQRERLYLSLVPARSTDLVLGLVLPPLLFQLPVIVGGLVHAGFLAAFEIGLLRGALLGVGLTVSSVGIATMAGVSSVAVNPRCARCWVWLAGVLSYYPITLVCMVLVDAPPAHAAFLGGVGLDLPSLTPSPVDLVAWAAPLVMLALLAALTVAIYLRPLGAPRGAKC